MPREFVQFTVWINTGEVFATKVELPPDALIKLKRGDDLLAVAVVATPIVRATVRTKLGIWGQNIIYLYWIWTLEEEGKMRTPIILVVDDEPQVLNLMALSLARHARKARQNWQIFQATDAATALTTARKLNCGLNVLVTDIQMPEITGEELIRQIRKICPQVDVLAISGALPDGSPGLANIQLLRKPFDMSLLAESVQDILAVQLQ